MQTHAQACVRRLKYTTGWAGGWGENYNMFSITQLNYFYKNDTRSNDYKGVRLKKN